MKFDLKELNELYYCTWMVRVKMDDNIKFVKNEALDDLLEKLGDEIFEINKIELELSK